MARRDEFDEVLTALGSAPTQGGTFRRSSVGRQSTPIADAEASRDSVAGETLGRPRFDPFQADQQQRSGQQRRTLFPGRVHEGRAQQQAFLEAGGDATQGTGENSREAIRQYNAAFNIIRGQRVDARREQQNIRLNTLAYETPPTLDNIGAIRQARAQLRDQQRQDAAQERAQAASQPGALEQANTLSQIQNRDIKTAADLQKQEADATAARREEAEDRAKRLEDLERDEAEATGDQDEIQKIARIQANRERSRQNFESAVQPGARYEDTFRTGSEERALADAIPALAFQVNKALGENTLGDLQTPGDEGSLKEALDVFREGFSEDIFQSSNFGGILGGLLGGAAGAAGGGLAGGALLGPPGAVGGAVLGGIAGGFRGATGPNSLPNINIATRGGGFEDVDTEDILNTDEGQILRRILNPADDAGRFVVTHVYGVEGAKEFYADLAKHAENPFDTTQQQ